MGKNRKQKNKDTLNGLYRKTQGETSDKKGVSRKTYHIIFGKKTAVTEKELRARPGGGKSLGKGEEGRKKARRKPSR